MKTSPLDGADWRILDVLQHDARVSYRQLARRGGLSAPAAAERVRRLEDAGLITGYRAEIALDKLFALTRSFASARRKRTAARSVRA